MKETIENKVVNDVTTKKKYVSPEIEVVYLDEEPKLLRASADQYRSNGFDFYDVRRDDW
ncbi:MAG: hypothetical protein J6T60_01935 [Bacteroidales bacterium]|nr:hypothetical protein [Bacteroidales bacterium]